MNNNKIKLTTKVKVETYIVLAAYKKKQENAPMLAVLQFIHELHEPCTAALLHQQLLYPLSETACRNLLLRLQNMGYLEQVEENSYLYGNRYEEEEEEEEEDSALYFELTPLGEEAQRTQTYFEDKKGELKITITKTNNLVKQAIVQITEYKSDKKNENSKDIPRAVEQLFDYEKNTYYFQGKEFKLKSADKKVIQLKDKEETLTVVTEENATTISLLGYERHDRALTLKKVRTTLLQNNFGRCYDNQKDWVKYPFDAEELSFERQCQFLPKLDEVTFDKIKLPIKVTPEHERAALQWFRALVKQKLAAAPYFWSKEEFDAFANQQATSFEEYGTWLQHRIEWADFVQELREQPKENFYILAKLITFNYLNY